ncbi:hypothetical protein Ciccas_013610 [Cichlidogyrus casuarinus]|uniref:Uncharacterized protein n=1 Tax=Cichlidogyrus casuarinus TaxID=1844966 RepID=A0ABD2PK63_9PLAT
MASEGKETASASAPAPPPPPAHRPNHHPHRHPYHHNYHYDDDPYYDPYEAYGFMQENKQNNIMKILLFILFMRYRQRMNGGCGNKLAGLFPF